MGDFSIVGLLRHHFHTSIISDAPIYVKRKLQKITKLFTLFYTLRNLKKQKTAFLMAIGNIKVLKVTKLKPKTENEKVDTSTNVCYNLQMLR